MLLKKLFIFFFSLFAGLLCKFYFGLFFNYYFAGFFYVLFWIAFFTIIFHNTNPDKIIIIVLIVTILLEFSQLLKFPFLEQLRKNFFLRALIGSSFSFLDFPFYFAAAFFAFLIFKFWIK
ncbi:MAG TPA: DUF2809 domain-containing protein [bacterium]|nr:DUF2809 domain-containing protein [bacterium]HOL46695.1 DUF2809 domain-containing protein [bacterium]HPQ18383.1 DUF2809 domain-containing protein [bacterium]